MQPKRLCASREQVCKRKVCASRICIEVVDGGQVEGVEGRLKEANEKNIVSPSSLCISRLGKFCYKDQGSKTETWAQFYLSEIPFY